MTNRTEYMGDISLLLIDFYSSDSDESVEEYVMNVEEWIDWNSEHLLNMYMICVEYFENEYLTFKKTFNAFCHFVYYRLYTDVDCEYFSNDSDLENLYDSIVDYCQMNNTFLFKGVSFEDFKNFIFG